MTITLTQKDADFILAYLRAELQKANEHFDIADEKEREISKMFAKNEDINGNPLMQLLMASVGEMREEYDALYRKKTDILIKCIELLTVGSRFGEWRYAGAEQPV